MEEEISDLGEVQVAVKWKLGLEGKRKAWESRSPGDVSDYGNSSLCLCMCVCVLMGEEK